MPRYAPDLIDYLMGIGDEAPTKILRDLALLRRSLSRESPMGLVAKVARSLEETLGNANSHPTITELSAYERGRIMSALGHKEKAADMYRKALETCKDPETRGMILVNLANDTDDPKEKEALLRRAIDQEHYYEALAHLGMLLERTGRGEEAFEALLESVSRGISLGIPMLATIVYKMNEREEFNAVFNALMRALTNDGAQDSDTTGVPSLDALMEETGTTNPRDVILHLLIVLAQKAGITDPVNAPFDQLDAQTLARTPSGKPINILTLGARERGGALAQLLEYERFRARFSAIEIRNPTDPDDGKATK